MVAEGDEHWPRNRGKLKSLVKVISRLLAAELVAPGGTLIVLACLLTVGAARAPGPFRCKRRDAPGKPVGAEGRASRRV
jgi:hypothetical protein